MKKDNKNKTAWIILVTICTVVIILGLSIILSIVGWAYGNHMRIVEDERENSPKDEKILKEWLINSGWEDEIEITKTEYKYHKANIDWFYSGFYQGYGYLNIYFNYNNQEYAVYNLSNYHSNNNRNNARIFWTIYHDEIIQHKTIKEEDFVSRVKGIKPTTTIEEAIQLYENSSIFDFN